VTAAPVGLPPLTPLLLSSRCRCRTARPGAGLRCRGAGGCGRLSGDENAACPLLLRIFTSRSAELSPAAHETEASRQTRQTCGYKTSAASQSQAL